MPLNGASDAGAVGPRRKSLVVVIPVLNEARNVSALVMRLQGVLETTGLAWRILFVDDGSRDETLGVIAGLNRVDPRITAISLSRRFGKEVAVAAGLRHVDADAVVLMDGDLQHPPETISEFLARWREGYEVIYGVRRTRDTDSRVHRLAARLFYGLFHSLSGTELPVGAGDFRLLDRKAIVAMNSLGERARFNKGLFAWIGFKSVGVEFDVAERREGQSRWRPGTLLRFALDGLTTFSTVPLRIATYIGLAVSAAAFLYVLGFLAKTLFYGIDVPGFPTTIISVLLLAGVQLVSLGIIGEYLGRVYEEVKARPLFLVRATVGEVAADPAATSTAAPTRAELHG